MTTMMSFLCKEGKKKHCISIMQTTHNCSIICSDSGTRRWSIENSFLSESDEKRREVKGSDTRLLRDFSPAMSWDLNPGDMLYLPPRIPHHG